MDDMIQPTTLLPLAGQDGRDLFSFRSYDEARLAGLAAQLAAAEPFPHLAIDDFIRLAPAAVTSRFPSPQWPGWNGFNDAYQHNKRFCNDIDKLPPLFQAMIHELCGPAFLRFLERVTGIRGLIPDPFLAGGGLHTSGPGGILAPHADFHHYGPLELFRRINVLVYFNPDWKADHGGCLELFRKGDANPTRSFEPEYGRMIMFLTDDRSIHGFTRPVSVSGRWRNSLALYYYTSEDTAHFSGDTDTHWQMHGSQNKARLYAYKGLLRVSRLFSRMAHRANPNFRPSAKPITREG